MAKKVFVSFLGLGKYENTRYYLNEEKKTFFDTPFIQEAVLRYLIKERCPDIQAKIFITKEAYKNWYANENNEGLKKRLITVNPNFSSSDIEISSGKSEKELLAIFLRVFDGFDGGDEIYFDITHGFRSLPMLAMVLLNYAKFLKNVKICGIYYGAFDAGQLTDGLKWSPVWDLTYFAKIQSWTNAANQFLQTGNGLMLSNLIEDEGMSNLKSGIENFTKEILVNRGPAIFSGNTQLSIQNEMNTLNLQDRDPLRIILEKVKTHFDLYKIDSILNGLNAVKWCIENGLIQQGATLLEEFATTYVLHKIGKIQFITDKDFRGIVSSALSVPKKTYSAKFLNILKDDEISLNLKNEEEEIISKIYSLDDYKKISETVRKIKKSIRDDINHAGFREQPRTYDEFKKSLEKRYNEFLRLI